MAETIGDPGIDIKPAGIDDFQVMRGIQAQDGFGHAYLLDEARLTRLLDRGERFFLATNGDEAIAFASLQTDSVRDRVHFFRLGRIIKIKELHEL